MSDWESCSYVNADEFTRQGIEDVRLTIRKREGTEDEVSQIEIAVDGDESMLVLRFSGTGEERMSVTVESAP